MNDKPYDQMTHDEILRVHGEWYEKLSPHARAQLTSERETKLRAELEARARWAARKLSELTAGDLKEIIEEAMTSSIKPILEEISAKLDKFE